MPARKFSHHFKLHRCVQGDHYHIIIGPENMSWPFWTMEAGLKLVTFSCDTLVPTVHTDEVPFIKAELETVRQEILAESRVQNRERGRFSKGMRMPRKLQPEREGSVATCWSRFRTGESKAACYIVNHLTGDWLLPLYCDFVKHSEPKSDKPMGRHELIALAEKPATKVTMAELGITLEAA